MGEERGHVGEPFPVEVNKVDINTEDIMAAMRGATE
jgi:hypothetical protein